MISIKDVAKKAGVSIATVSNVINETRNVSDSLKSRVNEAIDELGYEVDPLASSMKKKNINSIGLVTTKLTSLFYPYIIDGINKVAKNAGYELILYDTEGDQESEIKSIKRLTQTRASGIILDTSHSKNDEQYFLNLSGLSHRGYKMPIVSIENNVSKYGIDSVYVDNVEGGFIATNHLIEQGCQRIVHIMGLTPSSISQDRLLGYKRALSSSGIEIDKRLIKSGDFSQISGYHAMKKILDDNINFCGVFAANDQMAAGACFALREKDIRIPEDVQLVGYDNTFVASIVRPSITTVNIPKTEMGTQAARCLIDRIEGNPTKSYLPISMKLPVSLVIRQTTDKDSIPDWNLFDW